MPVEIRLVSLTARLIVVLSLIAISACRDRPEPQTASTSRLVRLDDGHASVIADAPRVPLADASRGGETLVVEIPIEKRVVKLPAGGMLDCYSLGGRVPGPMIRIHQADSLVMQVYPDAELPAVAAVEFYGKSKQARLVRPFAKAEGGVLVATPGRIPPGLYLYNLVTEEMIPHSANALFGLLLVEPQGGLTPVQREYQIVRNEFAVLDEQGSRAISLQSHAGSKSLVAIDDMRVSGSMPTLDANPGDTVRLFCANVAADTIHLPALIQEYFHLQLAKVATGRHPGRLVSLPSGSAAVFEFVVLDAQSVSMLATIDESDPYERFKRMQQEEEGQNPAGNAAASTRESRSAKDWPVSQAARMVHGRELYRQHCERCHQEGGTGISGQIPPLAGADFLMEDRNRAIRIVANGLQRSIVVNGEHYSGFMPRLGLSDEDIANILTSVRNSWGNTDSLISPAEVRRQRGATP